MRHGLLIALIALACGVCQTCNPPAAPLPPADTEAKPAEKDASNKDAEKPAEMCPVGFVHDFGKMQCGTLAKHTFRFINTSGVPLQVVSLRTA